jgi:hypothetical protein
MGTGDAENSPRQSLTKYKHTALVNCDSLFVLYKASSWTRLYTHQSSSRTNLTTISVLFCHGISTDTRQDDTWMTAKDLKGTELYYHGICLKGWQRNASLRAARDLVSNSRRGPPERSTPVRLLAVKCLYDDAASYSDHMKVRWLDDGEWWNGKDVKGICRATGWKDCWKTSGH